MYDDVTLQEHVMSYFNAELGVPCSLDPEGKLTFKGRFTPKQIESVVRKYMIGPPPPVPPPSPPPSQTRPSRPPRTHSQKHSLW